MLSRAVVTKDWPQRHGALAAHADNRLRDLECSRSSPRTRDGHIARKANNIIGFQEAACPSEAQCAARSGYFAVWGSHARARSVRRATGRALAIRNDMDKESNFEIMHASRLVVKVQMMRKETGEKLRVCCTYVPHKGSGDYLEDLQLLPRRSHGAGYQHGRLELASRCGHAEDHRRGRRYQGEQRLLALEEQGGQEGLGNREHSLETTALAAEALIIAVHIAQCDERKVVQAASGPQRHGVAAARTTSTPRTLVRRTTGR